MLGALAHAAHVRILREHGLAEGEILHGGRGVRAHSGQGGQVAGPAVASDLLRRAQEIHPAAVVAKALPGADDVRG